MKAFSYFFEVSDLYLVQTGLLERSSCTASKNAAFQNLSDCQMGCSLRKLYRKFLPWQPVNENWNKTENSIGKNIYCKHDFHTDIKLNFSNTTTLKYASKSKVFPKF